MIKFGALIVVGCLLVAGGPAAALDRTSSRNYALSTSEPSFKRLNTWLARQVESADPATNLEAAFAKLTHIGLFDGPLVNAIEALKDLSQVAECDSRTLGLLKYIQLGVSQFKDAHDDEARVSLIVRHLVGPNLVSNCESYVDKRLDELKDSLTDEKMASLYRLLRNYISDYFFKGYKNVRDHKQLGVYIDSLLKKEPTKHDLNGLGIVRLINQLAATYDPDGRHKFYEAAKELTSRGRRKAILRDYGEFARAFDVYLSEPCQHYLELVGPFFDNSLVLPEIGRDGFAPEGETGRRAFLERRSWDFQDALYVERTCKNLLMMSEDKFNTVRLVFDKFYPK